MAGAQAKAEPEALETAAAHWFTRMRSDRRTVQDEAAFSRWLADSDEHREAYRALELLWSGLEAHRDDVAIQALRSEALRASRQSASRHRLRRFGGFRIAGVAGACAVAAALTLGFVSQQDVRYSSGFGDRQSVRLADGSEVMLNTDSAIQVRYRPWSRTVELEKGEAHFKVAHNALRPFRVLSGNGAIRDIGTEFDVYRQPDMIQVTLIEGRVEVQNLDAAASQRGDTVELKPGEQVSLSEHGLSPVVPANLSKTMAWMHGALLFDRERLADALAEVNRYSALKLQASDPRLADLRISGVFHTGNTQSFLNALHESFSIVATPASGGGLMLSAAPAP